MMRAARDNLTAFPERNLVGPMLLEVRTPHPEGGNNSKRDVDGSSKAWKKMI